MNQILLAIILASTVAACGLSAGDLRAEKLAKLDSLRRETISDLYRQQAECQAIAIEFHGDSKMVSNCMETYKTMASMAQATISDIDRRVVDLNHNQFDEIDMPAR